MGIAPVLLGVLAVLSLPVTFVARRRHAAVAQLFFQLRHRRRALPVATLSSPASTWHLRIDQRGPAGGRRVYNNSGWGGGGWSSGARAGRQAADGGSSWELAAATSAATVTSGGWGDRGAAARRRRGNR